MEPNDLPNCLNLRTTSPPAQALSFGRLTTFFHIVEKAKQKDSSRPRDDYDAGDNCAECKGVPLPHIGEITGEKTPAEEERGRGNQSCRHASHIGLDDPQQSRKCGSEEAYRRSGEQRDYQSESSAVKLPRITVTTPVGGRKMKMDPGPTWAVPARRSQLA